MIQKDLSVNGDRIEVFMNLLTLEHISKSYTDRILFSDLNFGINEGDKIGLVGINGTGKSTLLKILAGLEEPDEGSLTKGKTVRIGYLSQTPVFDLSKTILQNVTANQKPEQDYHNLEGSARAMLQKLGISSADQSPSFLSGGQKKRTALVRTLLTPADLLILDEPTNHLDSEMTEWLEAYLSKFRGAFIMVTHDRYFLDRVSNKILELDKGKLYVYETNYSGFLERKAEREAIALATERKAKSLYKTELEWIQRGARARSTKQKAHIARFEALKDRERPETDSQVEISSVSSRLGKKIVSLEHISKGFEGRQLIRNFSYILLPGDRIGIVGPNGCGKSTLLKILTRQLTPDEGTVDQGSTVKVGYFSQENEAMDERLRVLDYIRDTAELIETTDGVITASQMCERFLFPGALQYSLISKLSGGEKRRLFLLKILMEAPNILILDEPTNDLDIQTLTILEDYLTSFRGVVVAVSHDRYFLDKMAKRIFAFGADGQITQFEGNYSDYKETISQQTAETMPVIPAAENSSELPGTKSSWKQKEPKLKFTYQEQKEFEIIDSEIASLEAQLKEVNLQIEEAASNYSVLAGLTQSKEALEQQLEEKMERWVYLNDLAEQIETAKNNQKT